MNVIRFFMFITEYALIAAFMLYLIGGKCYPECTWIPIVAKWLFFGALAILFGILAWASTDFDH